MVPPLGGQSPQAFPRAAPNELTSTRRRRRPFPIASSTFRVATAVFIIDVGRPAAHPRGAMDDVGGAHELRAIGAGQQGGGNDLRATRLGTVQQGLQAAAVGTGPDLANMLVLGASQQGPNDRAADETRRPTSVIASPRRSNAEIRGSASGMDLLDMDIGNLAATHDADAKFHSQSRPGCSRDGG